MATATHAAPFDTRESAVEPRPGPGNGGEKTLERFHRLSGAGTIDALFLGDSITNNWTTRGERAWEGQLGEFTKAIFGVAGDRTQYMLWRLQQAELDDIDPRVVVVLIGTNNLKNQRNTASETCKGIVEVVSQISKTFPRARVMLLGILPCGEDSHSIVRQQAAKVNAQLEVHFDGDARVRFFDAGERLVEADGKIDRNIMGDFLHPSPLGYERLSVAVAGELSKLLILPRH